MNHDGLQQPTTKNKSTEREESMEDKKPAFVFSRHIGNTTYSTNVCFDPQAPSCIPTMFQISSYHGSVDVDILSVWLILQLIFGYIKSMDRVLDRLDEEKADYRQTDTLCLYE